MCGVRCLHLRGADFAVGCRGKREYLVTGRLHSARLVHVDVSRFRAQRALVRAQNRRNHRRVRLRAADEEVHVDVVSAARRADLGARRVADLVLAVADSLHQIRVTKPLENLRMAALRIITVKVNHTHSSLFFLRGARFVVLRQQNADLHLWSANKRCRLKNLFFKLSSHIPPDTAKLNIIKYSTCPQLCKASGQFFQFFLAFVGYGSGILVNSRI